MTGLIILDQGTAYALSDNMNSQMILQYARDLTDLKISLKDGVAMLSAYGYQYKNASAIEALANSQDFVIGADGANILRRLSNDAKLQISMPDKGRVVIYAPDYSIVYDSLFETQESIALEAGSVLLLSGIANDAFDVKVLN
jgi:hypothetical protein